MATTKAKSSNDQKNAAGVIMMGGSSSDPKNTSLSFAQNSPANSNVGAKVIEAVSPSESGNIGTQRVLSGGTFGYFADDKYIGPFIGEGLAGIPGGKTSPGNAGITYKLPYANGNYRYHITSWDYVTGRATHGGNAGDLFTYWDAENGQAIAHEPFPTRTVPGELTYQMGSNTPVMDDYEGKTLGG